MVMGRNWLMHAGRVRLYGLEDRLSSVGSGLEFWIGGIG